MDSGEEAGCTASGSNIGGTRWHLHRKQQEPRCKTAPTSSSNSPGLHGRRYFLRRISTQYNWGGVHDAPSLWRKTNWQDAQLIEDSLSRPSLDAGGHQPAGSISGLPFFLWKLKWGSISGLLLFWKWKWGSISGLPVLWLR
ncbi:uncharacterized protein LOC123449137 [Hordeum vulgare subsp. vulgare]|uniref:uncharacterized protein LOC123449137 n=1 Tax=Hordeum vulgare subsp. vulgare TaxID=112509 RepID=UPI001D1A4F20|nr:uncharacterized protein LOC123449137 [Hordeum vulgare subsp. vulgare]